jgi:phage FluMu gp28-like protein
MPDAIELGLLNVINRTQGKSFTPEQFLANCRALAGSEEIFQQSYMCNPLGAATASIVEWSAIERCRTDYQIERVHLEDAQVRQQFGEFNPSRQEQRESQIQSFLQETFPALFSGSSIENQKSKIKNSTSPPKHRLGFDVAASGQGDLAAIYIDQAKDDRLKLRALFTCRTEDWNFLKTVLFYFMRKLKSVHGAGDESGLGRQICWEAAAQFSSRFLKVNLGAKKHDLGNALMNQLSNSEKHFPKNHPDIAADFFALRKSYTGTRWIFTEGRNTLNANSHCDIAWAAALASHAHKENTNNGVFAAVLLDNGMIQYGDGRIVPCPPPADFPTDPGKAAPAVLPTDHLLWSDDPNIWHRLR